MKLVTYRACDEVIVTIQKSENDMLDTWFSEGSGRYLDDYERSESKVAVAIRSGSLTCDLD